MSEKRSFVPYQGKEENISKHPFKEGSIYFATDTGRMYLDTVSNGRIPVGGGASGISFYYSLDNGIEIKTEEDEGEEDKEVLYTLTIAGLEDDSSNPKIGDILLGADKVFYKIKEITETDFICERLAIAGGGDFGTRVRPKLIVQAIKNNTIINGSEMIVYFTASSAMDEDTVLADTLTVTYSLHSGDSLSHYYQGTVSAPHGELYALDLTNQLNPDTVTKIYFEVSGVNHSETYKSSTPLTIITSKLVLEHTANFSSAIMYPSELMKFEVKTEGTIEKIIDCYFDGSLYKTEKLSANTKTYSIQFDERLGVHGYHTVKFELYQSVGLGERGQLAGVLEFEIAVDGKENIPIIWLGSYKKEYQSYESIKIPVLAYNPENITAPQIRLYKDGVELKNSPLTLSTDALGENSLIDNFFAWEIADFDIEQYNYYTISCENSQGIRTEREVTFKVVKGEMDIIDQSNLLLNFNPVGRSNLESKTLRQQWEDSKGRKATFSDFNWYNNGWTTDKDGNTVLKVSNGAKVTFPVDTLQFGGGTSDTISNTFEISFRISNIQDYSKLVTNITRYQKDEEYYNAFLSQDVYKNYDAYLAATLPPKVFDKLEFDHLEKKLNLKNIICSFKTGADTAPIGICIGTQDAFFSNGINTVSVDFVEDEIINLSFTYDSDAGLLLGFVNGIVTGATKVSDGAFVMDSGFIDFYSNNADIDILKLRVYNCELNVGKILNNYAVDKKDIGIYHQNTLAQEITGLGEFQLQFENIEAWNRDNPDNYTMPYIIFETLEGSDDKLSYSKTNTKKIKVEFVNPALERAYSRGELLDLAIKDGLCYSDSKEEEQIEAVKTYYKHHCPSWTGYNIALNVQGTSSEFYPRRNYKIKTKTDDEDKQERIHIFLNKGPFEKLYVQDMDDVEKGKIQLGEEKTRQSLWYMNNYTNGIHKWTMKVDFMESSGSYNAGFASLAANAYTKHPLEDYVTTDEKDNSKPILDKQGSELKGVVGKNIRWSDYRTSLLGFPVMAFHKKSDGSYTFIGYYRMLLDKGSDEVLGFKPSKNLLQKFAGNKKVRDIAECWEFSNNARTFCSYRDPWNRVKFQFKHPPTETNIYTNDGAPLVADSFEYRYHKDDDLLDLIYKYNDNSAKLIEEHKIYDQASAAEVLFEKYKNWEAACQWVWSTNMDNVISQNDYSIIKLGENVYEKNKYYILLEDGNYQIYDGEYDPNYIYYKKIYNTETEQDDYVNAYIVASDDYKYIPYKFYKKDNKGNFILCSDSSFDSSFVYYQATEKDKSILQEQCDLLVKPCNTEEEFDELKDYYNFNDENTVSDLLDKHQLTVNKVIGPTEEDFKAGKYYEPAPITYGLIEYKYDTKEYRNAKFIYELKEHFDIEYLSVYFAMTEAFQCYDSRGKNCMMASWGPLKEGGDYIWYPIFYDIDTQLGINNTGIPSFEFNVDTTEDNNYSTSDSILWNNFYNNFKQSYIKTKYSELRGVLDSDLSKPPLQSVDLLEKWYKFDPKETNNIAARGIRPLIATNLDLYFKYITITNPKAESFGVAYLGSNGEYEIDKNGLFFYALQGDRSQSRRQFLTNRFDYLDSWLAVGNYARAGANRVRGRISANDMSGAIISDRWIATDGDPYWTNSSETTKTHEFDAEYWLTLQPIYSSYITAGDDNSNYPPQKYDGVTPKKIELTALKPGITSSPDYPEQLVYIYGLNKMSDIGDMSNLYWREFYLEGKANKLTRLKLGHDGEDKDGNTWYNKQLNGISIPDLPLLKEMNLCNISLSTAQTLNLEKSEKLQNFRATGMSNLTEVKFAPGVSLKTLYLPSCINAFTLSEANNLQVLLKDYETPVKNNITGHLEAKEGLYLEDFFDKTDFPLIKIDINGGALRENSYDIFKHFVNSKLKNSSTGKGSTIKMKNIDWNKYSQLVEGDEYVSDDDSLYYYDNKHCGFNSYNYTGEDQFKKDILNGIVYKQRTDFNSSIDISDAYELLQKLSNSEMTFELTGSLWVDNSFASETIDEYDVFTLTNTHFPKLSVYFENSSKINKAYMAQFVSYNEDQDYSSQVYADNGDPLIQKIDKNSLNPCFNYPIYEPKKSYYDFIGWSKTKIDKVETSVEGYYNIDGDKLFYKDSAFTEKLTIGANANKYLYKDKNTNKIYTFESGNYYLINDFVISDTSIDTYIYYAVFQKKEYTITYNLGDSQETIIIKYGEPLQAPKKIPSKTDSSLDLTECYKFIGYSREENGKVVQLEGLRVSRDETFYAIFDIDSVYNNVHPEYFNFNEIKGGYIDDNNTKYNVTEGYQVSPKSNLVLSGKITIPTEYSVGGKTYPVIGLSGFTEQKGITHIFFENSNNTQKELFVRYINSQCFENCSNLLYFDFIDSIRIIRYRAFFNSNLSLVNYISNPNGLLYSIEESAFNGTKCGLNDKYIYICSPLLQIFGNTAFAYLSIKSGADIKFEINAKSLQTIGSRVFSQNAPVFKEFVVYQLDDAMQASFKNALSDSHHNVNEIIQFIPTEMPV